MTRDLSTLSPEEKNVRLAELVGWKCINATGQYAVGMDPAIIAKGEPAIACVARVPDYCSSLDAVAAVEATLSDEQQVIYAKTLWDSVGPTSQFKGSKGFWHVGFKHATATATQRTEALIATLSK